MQNYDVVGECWIWRGAPDAAGYGRIRVGGVQRYVHRVAYELFVGSIPEGLTIDHVAARGCVSRACMRPAHLEAVTLAENTRRGRAAQSAKDRAAARTHCANGHPWSPENTARNPRNARVCRACVRARASGRDPVTEPVAKRNRNVQAQKTVCPRGHEYSGRNNQGRRICKTCANARRRKVPHRDSGRVSSSPRGNRSAE